jgi:hypothetical protein
MVYHATQKGRRAKNRGLAQSGSAAVLGAAGRQFESGRPDHYPDRRTEGRIQETVMNILDLMLPADALAMVVPGGDRQKTRAPGYKSGTPDIIVVWRGKAFFIELKSATGALSRSQKEFHVPLAATGCPIAVCRNEFQVIQFLQGHGIEMRGSLS